MSRKAPAAPLPGTWTELGRIAQSSAGSPSLGALEEGGRLSWWSWEEAFRLAQELARGLVRRGLEPGERVGLLGRNRREFWLLELAVIGAGGVPVPIYPTFSPEQLAWILGHAGIRWVASDQLDTAERVRRAARRAHRALELEIALGSGPIEGSVPWQELLVREPSVSLPPRDPESPALLIYTSGTTGNPKGVLLSDRALWAVLEETVRLLGPVLEGTRFRVVSYLPLAHIAEQMMSIFAPIAFGGQAVFAPRAEELPAVLRAVQPTVFLGVPRVWEKLESRIEEALARSPVRRRVLEWAGRKRTDPRGLGGLLARWFLAKVHRKLGFGELRFALSGAAALSEPTFRFFEGLGIPIHEVYGMTESAALMTATRPGSARAGCAGQVLAIGELRLAADGEILYRGPNLFSGYLDDPAATRAMFDAEGFLKTGDLGGLDPEGYLRILGRKKELLVTSGGKNVAPAEIEPLLEHLEGISQAVLVGDGQPYLGALLTLKAGALANLVREAGLEAGGGVAPGDPRLCRLLLERIERTVNPLLAGYQRIRRIAVLPRELTVEAGELTPTLKLRREVILSRYRAEVSRLFLPEDSRTVGSG